MFGKIVRPIVAAGALAALLLTSAPAWAGTREPAPARSAWHWLTSLWQTGISALWTPPGGEKIDQGYGTDPNG